MLHGAPALQHILTSRPHSLTTGASGDMGTHSHVCAHGHTLTCTPIQSLVHMHAQSHTSYMHDHTYTHDPHVHTHTKTRMHMYTHVPCALTHGHNHTCVHACSHTRDHRNRHDTCSHAHTHMITVTHTRTYSEVCPAPQYRQEGGSCGHPEGCGGPSLQSPGFVPICAAFSLPQPGPQACS